ncbi:hypothetical protein B0H11DRAFT_1900588 [Mycena galericulata]|nr:hypothetical protein B0H11DRAFT_1900588 [Mycena galericulata]
MGCSPPKIDIVYEIPVMAASWPPRSFDLLGVSSRNGVKRIERSGDQFGLTKQIPSFAPHGTTGFRDGIFFPARHPSRRFRSRIDRKRRARSCASNIVGLKILGLFQLLAANAPPQRPIVGVSLGAMPGTPLDPNPRVTRAHASMQPDPKPPTRRLGEIRLGRGVYGRQPQRVKNPERTSNALATLAIRQGHRTPSNAPLLTAGKLPERQNQTAYHPKSGLGRSISGKVNNTSQTPYTSPQLPHTDLPDQRRVNDGLLTLAKLSNKPSQDTIYIPLRQTSGLLNEPPPCMPGPESANSHDDTLPRPSNDSEERPFEHWYRGEVSRNGGMGELKLGKRAEMLEIANYGHTLKQKQALAASRAADPSRPQRRKRSESAAGIEANWENVYLDEDHANDVGRVLDEGLLTDVDAEMSDDDYYSKQNHLQLDTSTASAPDPRYQSRTPTPQQTPNRTRIPSPTAPVAQPMQRGASEPPSFPASSSSLSQASRQLQNPKRSATASPTAASTSASKKPRAAVAARPKPKPKPKRTNLPATDEKNRGDMADAIPSWTQPVAPPTGRWDDVVLPAVARKKGLDGLYEQADGNPKPRKVEEPIAPAPGTFGWDHSKYRPPRGDNDIQMDEFGRPVERVPEEDEEHGAFGKPLYPPTEHERQPVGPQAAKPPPRGGPPAHPVPFSDHRPDATVNIDLEAAKLKYGGQPQPPRPRTMAAWGVASMTHQQFRRLARRGGVKRMGITASTRSALGNEIRSSLKLYLERIMRDAIEYSGHDYRPSDMFGYCRILSDINRYLRKRSASLIPLSPIHYSLFYGGPQDAPRTYTGVYQACAKPARTYMHMPRKFTWRALLIESLARGAHDIPSRASKLLAQIYFEVAKWVKAHQPGSEKPNTHSDDDRELCLRDRHEVNFLAFHLSGALSKPCYFRRVFHLPPPPPLRLLPRPPASPKWPTASSTRNSPSPHTMPSPRAPCAPAANAPSASRASSHSPSAPDVADPVLKHGGRRALVGLFGAGWLMLEFAGLPPKLHAAALKGLQKCCTPANAVPILYAAETVLQRASSMVEPWVDTVWPLLEAGQAGVDGVRGTTRPRYSARRSGCVVRGIGEGNAGKVYQALVNVLLLPHPAPADEIVFSAQPLLSQTSHVRVHVEQARMDILTWFCACSRRSRRSRSRYSDHIIILCVFSFPFLPFPVLPDDAPTQRWPTRQDPRAPAALAHQDPRERGRLQVTLMRVLEERCSVEVWDAGDVYEFKWNSIILGATTPRSLGEGGHVRSGVEHQVPRQHAAAQRRVHRRNAAKFLSISPPSRDCEPVREACNRLVALAASVRQAVSSSALPRPAATTPPTQHPTLGAPTTAWSAITTTLTRTRATGPCCDGDMLLSLQLLAYLMDVKATSCETTLCLAAAHAVFRLDDGLIASDPMKKTTLAAFEWNLSKEAGLYSLFWNVWPKICGPSAGSADSRSADPADDMIMELVHLLEGCPDRNLAATMHNASDGFVEVWGLEMSYCEGRRSFRSRDLVKNPATALIESVMGTTRFASDDSVEAGGLEMSYWEGRRSFRSRDLIKNSDSDLSHSSDRIGDVDGAKHIGRLRRGRGPRYELLGGQKDSDLSHSSDRIGDVDGAKRIGRLRRALIESAMGTTREGRNSGGGLGDFEMRFWEGRRSLRSRDLVQDSTCVVVTCVHKHLSESDSFLLHLRCPSIGFSLFWLPLALENAAPVLSRLSNAPSAIRLPPQPPRTARRWLDEGCKAAVCKCVDDSPRIDVYQQLEDQRIKVHEKTDPVAAAAARAARDDLEYEYKHDDSAAMVRQGQRQPEGYACVLLEICAEASGPTDIAQMILREVEKEVVLFEPAPMPLAAVIIASRRASKADGLCTDILTHQDPHERGRVRGDARVHAQGAPQHRALLSAGAIPTAPGQLLATVAASRARPPLAIAQRAWNQFTTAIRSTFQTSRATTANLFLC